MNQAALDAVNAHCTKQAGAGFIDAVQQAHSSQLQGKALSQLGRVLLTGAGLGIGARGLLGLAQLGRRNLKSPTPLTASTIPVDVPYPVVGEEEEKLAADNGVGGGVGDFLKGRYAQSMAGIPWMLPATILGSGASIYGGFKLMDKLLDNRRKAELNDDVEAAKSQFNQALMAEYDKPVRVPKVAADEELGRDLEQLFQNVKEAGLLEKDATAWDDLLNALGVGTGTYLTAAGIGGLAAGVGTYQATKKRQEHSLLQRANKMRQRQRWMSQPPALVAHPVPVEESPEFAL